MVNSTMGQSFPAAVVLRCIRLGLLCVLESALSRPSMLEFIFNDNKDLLESPTSREESSVNEVTNSIISAR